MVSSVATKSLYVLVGTYFHSPKPYAVSRCVMNNIFTAAASFWTFSGGFAAKKPIRRPNIRVQTASKPSKFTMSWKLLTTLVSGSLFSRSSSINSSHMVLSVGRKACNTRGLVIWAVNFARKLCQVSPCLKRDQNRYYYIFNTLMGHFWSALVN